MLETQQHESLHSYQSNYKTRPIPLDSIWISPTRENTTCSGLATETIAN